MYTETERSSGWQPWYSKLRRLQRIPGLSPWRHFSFCVKMMTSSNENIFRVTGHLCGEFTGPRWFPRAKASDAELWCFLFICVWINGWVNNREAGDLRRYRAHCDVIVMKDLSHILPGHSIPGQLCVSMSSPGQLAPSPATPSHVRLRLLTPSWPQGFEQVDHWPHCDQAPSAAMSG